MLYPLFSLERPDALRKGPMVKFYFSKYKLNYYYIMFYFANKSPRDGLGVL